MKLALGCLCALGSVVILVRAIRSWRSTGWRYRCGGLLQVVGTALGAFGLLSRSLDPFWGFGALVLGLLVIYPEELTRPVRLWHRRRQESNSEN